MLPAYLHRQFRHPFHCRLLRRFLAHPFKVDTKIKWFLQSFFRSNQPMIFSGKATLSGDKARTSLKNNCVSTLTLQARRVFS
jgi:hypothetical protein